MTLSDEPGILQIIRTGQGHYVARIPLPAFPPYLQASSIIRGWGYVDARMNGTPFRFITTHLEDGTNSTSPLFAYVQALQEIQLVYLPALTILPVMIGGDFNTVANDPSRSCEKIGCPDPNHAIAKLVSAGRLRM